MDQLLHIFLPFIIALFQVMTAALALGMIPALWCIAARKRFPMLIRWGLFFLILATAAVYGLPLAMRAWRASLDAESFKESGMYFAYFVGILFAFYLIPEPKRIAQNRLRQWNANLRQEAGEGALRVRRVRRRRTGS